MTRRKEAMNLHAIVLALIQPKMKEEAMNLHAIVFALIQPKMKVSRILVTY